MHDKETPAQASHVQQSRGPHSNQGCSLHASSASTWVAQRPEAAGMPVGQQSRGCVCLVRQVEAMPITYAKQSQRHTALVHSQGPLSSHLTHAAVQHDSAVFRAPRPPHARAEAQQSTTWHFIERAQPARSECIPMKVGKHRLAYTQLAVPITIGRRAAAGASLKSRSCVDRGKWSLYNSQPLPNKCIQPHCIILHPQCLHQRQAFTQV